MREKTEKEMREIFGDEQTDVYFAYMKYRQWREENGMDCPHDLTMEALAKFAYWSETKEVTSERTSHV